MITAKVKRIIKGKKAIPVYDIIGLPNSNFVADHTVVHNCDESIRFASSEDWNKKENKELKKKLAQVRTKHLFYILCFPLKAYKVEKTYLQSFVNYWVHIYRRGYGSIFVQDDNPVEDSWKFKSFRTIGSFNEFTPPKTIRDRLKKHPNFWRVIRFPKPPKWLYERYLTVREDNVYNDKNVLANVSKEDIHRAALIIALRDVLTHGDSTLTINRIILHLKNQHDLSLSKSNVEHVIEDAKQLVSKVKEELLDY